MPDRQTLLPSLPNRDLQPFYVMELAERADALRRAGRDIVSLAVGELDFAPPQAVNAAVEQALQAGQTKYTDSLGSPELRQCIADAYVAEGVSAAAEQVLVSSGTSPVLFAALASVTDPGDEVVLLNPGYPCYPNFARLLGCEIRDVPVSAAAGFRPDPDKVAAAVTPRTKAIMLCSPANPTGVTLTLDELSALADIGPWLIVDEIYRGIEYGNGTTASALALQRDHVIVVDGFSKRFAMTGFRLGYGLFPPQLMPAAQAIQQSLVISANPFVQAAGVAALTQPEVIETRRDWLAALTERRQRLLAGLDALGIAVPAAPEGAFYLLADFRWCQRPSLELALDILDTVGVALTPGIDFGSAAEGFLRFSFAPALDTIADALQRLERWLAGQR